MSTFRRAVTVVLAAIGLPVLAQAQQGSGCADRDVFRQMDYWAGTWEVYNGQGEKSADVTVRPILEDCALYEEWNGVDGGSDGRGMATYDTLTKEWRYFWVADYGYVSTWTGTPVENGVRFVRTQPAPGGQTKLRHWDLLLMDDGRIQELARASLDGGETWEKEYELFWRPKEQ